MRKTLYILFFSLLSVYSAKAGENPTITWSMTAVDCSGKEYKDVPDCVGSAPITATFSFQTHDADEWTCTYEWRFAHEGGSLDEPYMIRYEESPEVTFTDAGHDSIAIYCTFSRAGYNDVEFRSMYWHSDSQVKPMTVYPSPSKLIFPNAFSPNGDGANDYFKPKEYESIVEFHAAIYNRWGHKVYEWSDITSNGWDGTSGGRDVKQGVYFLLCKAKGADGTPFEIKKDVNLLRSYDSEYDKASTEP